MDCDALNFDGQMAGWNMVSMATQYASWVEDPSALKLQRGLTAPQGLRGYAVSSVNPNRIAQQHPDQADLAEIARTSDKPLFLFDPITGEPARDSTGQPYRLAPVAKGSPTPGVTSGVSWRGPTGVELQVPGGIDNFLTTLAAVFPEVNVIRLDLNTATLANSERESQWRAFALEAAARGYRLVIQDSDGELAGGFVRKDAAGESRTGEDPALLAPARLGPQDALSDPHGQWKINQVKADWQSLLAWFHRPENSSLASAVLGWELINEPRAYPGTREGAALYSRHIHDLISALDWGADKRLFVGGMRASAQFNQLDLAQIRAAAGARLVWSWHLYPQWAVAKTIDPDGAQFYKSLCARIGSLAGSGDAIALTESQIISGPGLTDPASPGQDAAMAWNYARDLHWFSDHGIAWTWWPPVGRKQAPMQWQGGKRGYEIDLAAAAFAHEVWAADETAPPAKSAQQGGEARFGSPGDDQITIDTSHHTVVSGPLIATPHGLAFGFQGDDALTGGPLPDLLYGGPGRDQLKGGEGNDYLFGDQGDDSLSGGEGDDFLYDRLGQNRLEGGPGQDTLEGSGTLLGGAGDDLLVAPPGPPGQLMAVMTGGPGRDRFAPSVSGRVVVTDFTPGEDHIDLSQFGSSPKVMATLVSQGPQGVEIGLGQLRLVVQNAKALTPQDFINTATVELTQLKP